MEQFLKIGQIVKPQGVKGEVKIQPLTPDLARFKGLKEVYIDGKLIKIISCKIGVDSVIISFFGIADRNGAELLRGKFISVDRENAIPLSKNTFFVADIVGSTVLTDSGSVVGKVTDITSLKTDIFTVLTVDNKILRFPFLKDLIVNVDVDNQRITLKEKRLQEVSVYED